jgi:hypothetical protein
MKNKALLGSIMKSKYLRIGLIASACGLFGLANSQAVTIELNGGSGYALINSPYAVGTVISGIQSGGQVARDVLMTNNLLTFASGGGGSINGHLYQRSSFFGALPAAIATGGVPVTGAGLSFGTNGSGPIVSLTLTSPFQYLVAAYDGPNGGAIVYNISGLAAGTVIEMARYAEPLGSPRVLKESSRYQMTGWTLLNPGTSVPEGGATLILLGASLGGLALLRRFLHPSSAS